MLDRVSPDPAQLHRPDGAAVPVSGLRLRRQVPGARARVTSAWRTFSRSSIAGSASQRGTPPPELSLRWRGLEDRRNPLIRYVPWWVVGAAALAMLAIALHRLLRQARQPRVAGPRGAREDRPRGFRPPVDRARARARRSSSCWRRKKQPDPERRRARRRTVVTLLGARPVRVGQRDGEPDALSTRCSGSPSAINQVPGRVLVVGHTDDQPVRSLRFRDNFELSRERALSVARCCSGRSTTTRAVSWTASVRPSRATARSRTRRTARATGASRSSTCGGDLTVLDACSIPVDAPRVPDAPRASCCWRCSSGTPGRISRSPTTARSSPRRAPDRRLRAGRRALGRVPGCCGGCAPIAPATGWSPPSSSQARGERPGRAPKRVQLRERFEEAVATLKQQRRRRSQPLRPAVVRDHRRAGIGQDHGAAQFRAEVPARAARRQGALRGVGGTRNCDWWFTDEAVFLDTAGRYTTQDSDATSDSAAGPSSSRCCASTASAGRSTASFSRSAPRI